MPPGLEKIGVEAFYECTNLKAVVLPDTVKEIQRQAFTNDRYFRELVLPQEPGKIRGIGLSWLLRDPETDHTGVSKRNPDENLLRM